MRGEQEREDKGRLGLLFATQNLAEERIKWKPGNTGLNAVLPQAGWKQRDDKGVSTGSLTSSNTGKPRA